MTALEWVAVGVILGHLPYPGRRRYEAWMTRAGTRTADWTIGRLRRKASRDD